MPKIQSAKKRVRQTKKRTFKNLTRTSAIKTVVKKFLAAVEDKDLNRAKELLRQAESQLARAKGKHVVHAKTAARKISRLAKKVAALEKPKA